MAATADKASLHIRETLFMGRAIRDPTDQVRAQLVKAMDDELKSTGAVSLGVITVAYRAGLAEQVFEAVDRASFDALFEPSGTNPGGWYSASILFDDEQGIWRDPRFVRLSGKLGLNAFWSSTDRWPDVAAQLPPSFKDAARRTVAP
jgi:hypothetical protein